MSSPKDFKKTPPKPPRAKTVAEVLAQAPKPPPAAPTFEQVWRAAVLARYGGFVPALTAKQQGQLKHFAKACPAGQARAVLEHAIADWIGFVQAAVSDAGAYSPPARPRVEFLLKHVGVAVNAWQAQQKKLAAKAVQLTAKPQPAPQPPPVQLTAEPPSKPKHVKATKAEIFAILGMEELEE